MQFTKSDTKNNIIILGKVKVGKIPLLQKIIEDTKFDYVLIFDKYDEYAADHKIDTMLFSPIPGIYSFSNPELFSYLRDSFSDKETLFILDSAETLDQMEVHDLIIYPSNKVFVAVAYYVKPNNINEYKMKIIFDIHGNDFLYTKPGMIIQRDSVYDLPF